MKRKITLALAVVLAIMTIITVPFPERETNATATVATEPKQTGNPAGEVSADALSLLYEPFYDAANDKAYYCYVYFGEYPQTEVTGEALTEKIINAEYDSNQDVEVSGQKYRRIQRSDTQFEGETINEGDSRYYNWNVDEEVNSYHYFLYEPVKWRVLSIDGSTLFLMADSVLDARIYDSGWCEGWKDSEIRSWLNGYDESQNTCGVDYRSKSFIGSAFTEEQKQALQLYQNEYDAEDYIFLLSDEDTLKESYGFSSSLETKCESRRLSPGDYAYAMGVSIDSSTKRCKLWLRNDYIWSPFVSFIGHDGIVWKVTGSYGIPMNAKHWGVCPAMYLDTSLTDTWTAYVPEPPVITPIPIQTSTPTPQPTLTPSPSPEPTVSPVPTPTPAPALLRGDVDGNQIVELLDAQLVLKAALGIAAIPEEKCSAADCNEDGQITLEDAQTVLKIALGIDENS